MKTTFIKRLVLEKKKKKMNASDDDAHTPPPLRSQLHRPHPLPSSSSLNEQFQRMWHQRERDYLPHPLNKNTRTKREKKRKVGVLFCATIAFMFGVYLYVIGHKLSELFLYMNWTRAVGDIDNHNNNKATSARPMMLLLKI